ncbi:MAG: ECF-type sigma factor, partial [Planctomycetota bacterium]
MQRFDDVTDRDLEHLYGQLRPIASRLLAGEGSASLQTTELVHEIFLRMWDERELEDAMADPPAMLGLMAHRMQRILVDRARKKHAAKRGGGYKFVPFDDAIHMLHESPENLVHQRQDLVEPNEV